MTALIVRRIVFAVCVLAAVSLATFSIGHLAPGDPARLIAGPEVSAATVETLRHKLGLGQPLWRQYLIYVRDLTHGDLGVSSVTGRPVLDEIATRGPASIELLLSALLVALAAGIPLGAVAARRPGGWADRLTSGLAVLGASTPAFWFGLILIVVFYRDLQWFPGSGRFTGEQPPTVSGFYTIDALLAGDLARFSVAVSHLALPVMSMSLLDLGFVARLTRNQMLGVLSQEYIRVARAGGLSESEIVTRHALKNALSPLITTTVASLATLLYGSVSVETVFGWPGAGLYVVNAIASLDFPVIMGFAALTSLAYVAVMALADLAQAGLDPRLRTS